MLFLWGTSTSLFWSPQVLSMHCLQFTYLQVVVGTSQCHNPLSSYPRANGLDYRTSEICPATLCHCNRIILVLYLPSPRPLMTSPSMIPDTCLADDDHVISHIPQYQRHRAALEHYHSVPQLNLRNAKTHSLLRCGEETSSHNRPRHGASKILRFLHLWGEIPSDK